MAIQDRGHKRGKGEKERELTPEELERQVLRKEEDRQRAISDWCPKPMWAGRLKAVKYRAWMIFSPAATR